MEFLSRMSHFMPIVDKIQLLLTVLSIMVARGKININQNISIYGRWQMQSFMSTCGHLCSLCSPVFTVFTCVHCVHCVHLCSLCSPVFTCVHLCSLCSHVFTCVHLCSPVFTPGVCSAMSVLFIILVFCIVLFVFALYLFPNVACFS
jgi:hypothetical protein